MIKRRTGDVGSIFHRIGPDQDSKMSFEAEIIIPKDGEDDSVETVVATTSFLRYWLELGYRVDAGGSSARRHSNLPPRTHPHKKQRCKKRAGVSS